MKRVFYIVFACLIITLASCTQRMICPAYQSAFIYDKDALRKKFSYFNEDSTPKVLMASKTKYLIAEPMSYQKKLRSMATVEMKPLLPVVPDSLRDDFVPEELLDSAARTIIDSTYIVDVPQKKDSADAKEDSLYVITKDKELRFLKYNADSAKYSIVEIRLNVDQDNYMWYLRDVLVLPDVRLAKMQAKVKKEGTKEKKGFFGFFRDLFKKKEAPDSTLVQKKSEDDFDYVDTLQTAKPVAVQKEQKKKGFFSSLKQDKADNPDQSKTGGNAGDAAAEPAKKEKKKKKKKDEDAESTEPPQTQPPKKEADQGDGF